MTMACATVFFVDYLFFFWVGIQQTSVCVFVFLSSSAMGTAGFVSALL